MTPSTPWRSGSACQSGTPSPPMSSTARRASRSSSEPGNVTTPILALTARGPPGSGSPRSRGSRAAGRPSPRPASAPPTPIRLQAPAGRACLPARRTRSSSRERGAPPRPLCPAGPPAPASGSPGPRRRTSRVFLPESLERRVVGRHLALAGCHPGAGKVVDEELSGDPFVCLHVSGGRALDDLGGQGRCRRFPVPSRPIEPVSDELLVERGLIAARRVAVGRPEARGIGRADLIDHDQLSVRETELELRVREDDAAGGRGGPKALVDLECELFQSLVQTPADEVGGLLGVERDVVSRLGLARRSEDGSREPLGCGEALGQRHTA